MARSTLTAAPHSLTRGRSMADGNDGPRQMAASTSHDPQLPSKIKAHLCKGIACMREARQYGQQRRRLVNTQRSKCPRCLTVYRAVAMAKSMEAAVYEDMSILADILEAHVRCNASNELTLIASALEQHLSSSDQRWTIARDKQRCRTLSDSQRKAVRMICNTLCLPLHGVTAGVDPTLTDSQRLVMRALARTWCPGTCAPSSAASPLRTRSGSPEQCPECLYWRRHDTTTQHNSHCLSCLQFRYGPTDQGAAHPCRLCEMKWLTIQNPVEQRVALLSQQELSQPDWQPIQSACMGDARQRPQWRHSSITQAPGHAVADA